MKKSFIIFLCLIISFCYLTGCGDKGNSVLFSPYYNLYELWEKYDEVTGKSYCDCKFDYAKYEVIDKDTNEVFNGPFIDEDIISVYYEDPGKNNVIKVFIEKNKLYPVKVIYDSELNKNRLEFDYKDEKFLYDEDYAVNADKTITDLQKIGKGAILYGVFFKAGNMDPALLSLYTFNRT